MNDVKIIICRYNENLSWIDKFIDNVVVYNKGEDISYDHIKLTNMGREGHAYLYHIVNNYDNLSDYNIFLQGNPHDHNSNIDNVIYNYFNENNLPEFEFLSNLKLETDFLAIREPYMSQYKNFHETYRILFGEYPEENHSFVFGANGLFAVCKDRIRKRPKEFYQNLLDCFEGKNKEAIDLELLNDISGNFNLDISIIGYHIERLWGKIFN